MVRGRIGHAHHRANSGHGHGHGHDRDDDSDVSAMNSRIATRRNSKESDFLQHHTGNRSNSTPLTLTVNTISHSEKIISMSPSKNGGHALGNGGNNHPSGHPSSSSAVNHLEGIIKTSQSNIDLPRSSGQISPRGQGPVHLPPVSADGGGNMSPRGRSPVNTIEHLLHVKTPSPTLVGPNANGEGSGIGGSGGGSGGANNGPKLNGNSSAIKKSSVGSTVPSLERRSSKLGKQPSVLAHIPLIIPYTLPQSNT